VNLEIGSWLRYLIFIYSNAYEKHLDINHIEIILFHSNLNIGLFSRLRYKINDLALEDDAFVCNLFLASNDLFLCF